MESCKCRVCVYGKQVRGLIYRTQDAADKVLIEELYDNLIHAEDDRDYHSIKNEGCTIKHGGISFPDACHAIDTKKVNHG